MMKYTLTECLERGATPLQIYYVYKMSFDEVFRERAFSFLKRNYPSLLFGDRKPYIKNCVICDTQFQANRRGITCSPICCAINKSNKNKEYKKQFELDESLKKKKCMTFNKR